MTEKFIAYTEEKSLKSKKITNTTVFDCAVVGLITQDYFFFLRSLIRVDWFYNVKNIWFYWNTSLSHSERLINLFNKKTV